MPRGEPRSVPDPAGEQYDAMIRQERQKRQRAEGVSANRNLPPTASGPPPGVGHPAPAIRAVPNVGDQAGGGAAHPGLPKAVLQADTAIRGAANVLTFGGADNLEAAMDALPGAGGLEGWRRRYDANLKEQHDRNRYDALHRRVAQATGQLGAHQGAWRPGPVTDWAAASPAIAGVSGNWSGEEPTSRD
jgi:hypothetical protein